MSKLKINRFFCKGNCPYYGINFITTANTIKNADGSIAMHWDNLIMPDTWESLSINIMARNYLRKKGIPKNLQKKYENGIYDWLSPSYALDLDEDTICETDARQVFDRLAGAWTYWGVKGKYFDSEEDAKNFYNEIRYMLVNQMAAPNSPQWFNTGLHWAYGIEGNAQGHYFFNEETKQIEQSSNAYYRPQPHACFIQSIKDSLVEKGGILDLVQREALLFKYGSGTGTNFSALRGKGEKLSGGGTSSGLMSFLKIGDVAAGSIKSGGTTRRAAKMVILNIDHPEIIEFIQWKNKEEEKVLDFFVGAKKIKEHTEKITKAFENKSNLKDAIENATAEGISTNYLIKLLLTLKNGKKYEKQTVSLDWNANAYDNIFGQNSNNSVRISDEFISAVINDNNFDLKFRTTGETYKTLKAQYLWDEIANAAWGCADPGIQFDTTINDWHTCPNSGKINGSNPCSEYMFLDDTACNLASLNLIKFVKNNKFDTESFIHACKLWTIVLEISVYMAQFPSETIALQSYQFRTLGLGYGNLGALLMQQGIAYDSDEGRNTAAGITALMQGIAYKTSAEMAKFLGPFEKFNDNKESMLNVIHNHQAAVLNNNHFKNLHIIPQSFKKDLCIFKNINEILVPLWNEVVELGKQHGYRNAQVSVIAPTGTIGIVMGFKTTGVEPLFAQIVYKPLSGGGMMKLVNDDIDIALHNLKYTENEIKDICNYVTGHYSFNGPIVCNTEFLKSQGITTEEITLVEKELPTSFEVQQAFKILPDSFFTRLSLSKEKNILEQFKLTELEIEEANLYCCGNMTIEGAPHLKDEHINIFDCCLPSGKGTRSLNYQSHIQMMAAIQPFLSGAISKTINLPNIATIKDCQNAYLLAWQLGLKSVALYRDGSKYSQVLNTSTNKKLFEEFYTDNTKSDNLFSGKGYSKKIMINNQSLIHTVSEDNEGIIRNVNIDFGKEGSTLKGWVGAWSTILSLYLQKKGTQALFKTYKAFKHSKFEPMGNIKGHNKISYANSIPDYIVEDLIISYPNELNIELPKNTLPYQREGKINKIKIGQETIYLIIGEDQTGLPCEVFVAGMGNEGSDLKGWMNSCAKLLSLYFQDCKTEAILTFIEKFENSSFNPSGLVVGHDTIKFVSSPLDFLAKYLKHKYEHILSLTQTQLLNLSQDKTINTGKQYQKTQRIIVTGYLDEACKVCKAFKLKSNGSCYICEACGSTTGCS